MLELIIFGGFLGLNMIVSMARESSADFFCYAGFLAAAPAPSPAPALLPPPALLPATLPIPTPKPAPVPLPVPMSATILVPLPAPMHTNLPRGQLSHSSVLIFLTYFSLSPFFNGSALKKLMPSAPASIDILAIR